MSLSLILVLKNVLIRAGTIKNEKTNNIPATPTDEVMTTPNKAKNKKSQKARLETFSPKLTAMICFLK